MNKTLVNKSQSIRRLIFKSH